MKPNIRKIALVFSIIGVMSCEKPLEEEIFSSLAPSTLFTTESGIKSVLNASYAYAHRSGVVESWSPFWLAGMTTGETWGAGGSIESLWVNLQDFTWDSNHSQILAMWTVYYSAIRDANIVLDNLDKGAFSDNFKKLSQAEINFIRGWSYSELFNLFGAVPLYKSSTDDPLQPRASEADVRAFIEQELKAAIEGLPVTASAYGRASKGAAMGVLCKYYMNTKQWQNAADLAKQIMDSGQYTLVTDYSKVFAISNEGNKEMVWALTKSAISATTCQNINALVFPTDYPRPYTNNGVFAARTYLFDSFVNSFEASDVRKKLIITSYVNTAGKETPGLGKNQSFPYKYEFDPGSVGPNAGNDLPIVRYADVLLSRAEALNELSGPSQEVVDLINLVRARAQATPLSLAGFTKETMRDAILQERSWEFFFEAKRREDLLRHDRFITGAVARGKKAQPFHALFPIPQVELDANALLTQNPGY